MALVTNSRSMTRPWSVVAAVRSSPRKAVRTSAVSQARSMVATMISPTCARKSSPSRSRAAPKARARISLGSTGSCMAAANRPSLVP